MKLKTPSDAKMKIELRTKTVLLKVLMPATKPYFNTSYILTLSKARVVYDTIKPTNTRGTMDTIGFKKIMASMVPKVRA